MKEAMRAWLKTPAGQTAVKDRLRAAAAEVEAGKASVSVRLADLMLEQFWCVLPDMQEERRAERRAGFSASNEGEKMEEISAPVPVPTTPERATRAYAKALAAQWVREDVEAFRSVPAPDSVKGLAEYFEDEL